MMTVHQLIDILRTLPSQANAELREWAIDVRMPDGGPWVAEIDEDGSVLSHDDALCTGKYAYRADRAIKEKERS